MDDPCRCVGLLVSLTRGRHGAVPSRFRGASCSPHRKIAARDISCEQTRFVLPNPLGSQPHYGEHLGDPDYWGPYVVEVARRESLPIEAVEAPFVGSFPTFLMGDLVVKLFGEGFDGPAAWDAERSMHALLESRPDIPAPALIAAGALFDGSQGWRWPYLVTQRLRSRPVRERPLVGREGVSTAGQLGEAVAALHRLAPPGAVTKRDLVPQLRSDATSRLTQFGLPQHLVEQVPEFLSDAPAPTTLVHADTANHLFHDGKAMTGIIDWGDAIVADRFYELVAIAFDCFDADLRLLDAFLWGYGWDVDDEFAKNATQAVCEFQFNAVTRISSIVDLDAAPTLDALAEQLFGSLRA